jgi:predicted transcriptional regulator
MKCIKNLKTGNIIRVDEKQSHQMVGREWKYVPKSEWKLSNGNPKVTEQVAEKVTEQVERKPYKKGSKPENRK